MHRCEPRRFLPASTSFALLSGARSANAYDLLHSRHGAGYYNSNSFTAPSNETSGNLVATVAGASTSATRAPRRPLQSNTTAPVITGTTTAGATLTTTDGVWLGDPTPTVTVAVATVHVNLY